MKHLIATLLLVLAALVSLSQNVLRERADAAFRDRDRWARMATCCRDSSPVMYRASMAPAR